MILVALGANLPGPGGSTPRDTLLRALDLLAASGVRVVSRSRWFDTAPVPASDQPHFVNAVVRVVTALEPAALLALLHRIEAQLGRERGERNAARTADLDLIDYDGRIENGGGGPILPHPRAHLRAFVLLPLADVAPAWRHPVLGRDLDALIRELPCDQTATPFAEG